jgi:glucosamine--fructose-6-phosphate aminotransferase (isomerizing)
VIGSTIAREADSVVYTNAGPEISVASTKAYVTQLGVMYMIALKFAFILEKISGSRYTELQQELLAIPGKLQAILEKQDEIQRFASTQFNADSIFFIGRGLDYYLSMEASLKLKEISYIHSESYPGGELKHGTIALIEEHTPVIALCCNRSIMEKTLSNIVEVKARGAEVLALKVKR